jgi:TetR/AcrR family transcriptional repressor of nem operon
MDKIPDRKAETRQRILNAASAVFRRHGVDGVGVDAIMDRAGLTHGGFYGHFASKEALVAEVCAHELGQSAARWAEMAGQPDGFARIVAQYLRPQHAEIGDSGCVLTTLGPEVARRREACSRVTEAMRNMADTLALTLPARRSRPRALAALSTLVGAVVLARASSDPALAAEILQAAQAALSPPKA